MPYRQSHRSRDSNLSGRKAEVQRVADASNCADQAAMGLLARVCPSMGSSIIRSQDYDRNMGLARDKYCAEGLLPALQQKQKLQS